MFPLYVGRTNAIIIITKKKLSEIKKGTGVGENNSVYGRKWMTKNFKNKMVKPEEVNLHLDSGWLFGKYIEKTHKNSIG